MIKLTKSEFLKIKKKELSGKVLCFITDTVWGVGVMVDENIELGLTKIYEMKKRDLNKPLAVLVDSVDTFKEHVHITHEMEQLFSKWPGALTLIFSKKDDFFHKVTTTNTIGIRIPDCNVTLDILKYIGPCATTSVNISSNEPLNDLNLIDFYFHQYIDYLVTDLAFQSKKSSTVVDVSKFPFKVLREGDIKF